MVETRERILYLNVVPGDSITRRISVRRNTGQITAVLPLPVLTVIRERMEEVKLEMLRQQGLRLKKNDGLERLVHQDTGAYPGPYANEPTTPC